MYLICKIVAGQTKRHYEHNKINNFGHLTNIPVGKAQVQKLLKLIFTTQTFLSAIPISLNFGHMSHNHVTTLILV